MSAMACAEEDTCPRCELRFYSQELLATHMREGKHRGVSEPLPAKKPRRGDKAILLTEADLNAWTWSDLKSALSARGVSFQSALEKPEHAKMLFETQYLPQFALRPLLAASFQPPLLAASFQPPLLAASFQPPPAAAARAKASSSKPAPAAASLQSSDSRLAYCFSGGEELVSYKPPPTLSRPLNPWERLSSYWKVVGLAHIKSGQPAASRNPLKGPPPHITVFLYTERGGEGTPLTGPRVAAFNSVAARFRRASFVMLQRPDGKGFTAPNSALVRLRRESVAAANAAEPRERPLLFHSTDGGDDEIANCHVTAGLAPARLQSPADCADAGERAWLAQQAQQPFGWRIELDLTVEASPAPLRCNDELHQALLWLGDKNQTAAIVAKAEEKVDLRVAQRMKSIGPVRLAHVKEALAYLGTGLKPAERPQYG